MVVCCLSLHPGSSESRKTLEQKFIFQIGTLNPHGINEHFSFKKLFLFSRHDIPTNSIAPFSAYKPTHNPQFLQSLWRRANARRSAFKLFVVVNFTFSTQLLTLNYMHIFEPRSPRPQLVLARILLTKTWIFRRKKLQLPQKLFLVW